jgi:hypothetical protein
MYDTLPLGYLFLVNLRRQRLHLCCFFYATTTRCLVGSIYSSVVYLVPYSH